MRSQIYYQCIASANSPLALVKQGLEEFIFGFDIDPAKLVLGVPWYGYKYSCTPPAETAAVAGGDSICALTPVRPTACSFPACVLVCCVFCVRV